MTSPLSSPAHADTPIRRVAILFAGGPAPAANAVISTAADSFLRNDIEVVGILHGYSRPGRVRARPAAGGRPERLRRCSTPRMLRRTRNSQGILIGTARANPGKHVSHPAHLDDPERVAAAAHGLRSAALARRRRADFDRRRRHAQDGQQVQAVSGSAAGRRPADSGRPSAQDDRQRLLGHRFHVRLLHGRRYPGQRNSQPAGRRRSVGARITWPRRWAAAPAGWPTARRSPAKPAW